MHLAIIMDGNGRFAQGRQIPRIKGHEKGAEACVKCLKDFIASDLACITFYAFSTENANRNEAAAILKTIEKTLSKDVLTLAKENGLKVRFVGNRELLPDTLKKVVDTLEAECKGNKGKQVVFALGYGGYDEVCRAVDRIIEKRGSRRGEKTTVDELKDALDTSGLNDIDAVVRYGGYKRLSNFLPLQTAYSELFFLDKLWPEYEFSDIENVVKEYASIKRKFGGE